MDQTRETSRLIERLKLLAERSTYPGEREAAQKKIDALLLKYAQEPEPAPVKPVKTDFRDASMTILFDNAADISDPVPPPDYFYWWR